MVKRTRLIILFGIALVLSGIIVSCGAPNLNQPGSPKTVNELKPVDIKENRGILGA